MEVRDLAQRGRSTPKLLQTFDPTVDISVGDLVGRRSLRETYLSLGVLHRSGVLRPSRTADPARSREVAHKIGAQFHSGDNLEAISRPGGRRGDRVDERGRARAACHAGARAGQSRAGGKSRAQTLRWKNSPPT